MASIFGYVLTGDASDRDYTVIDFTPPRFVSGDIDREVNFMEFVRTNFAKLVEGVPAEGELYLVAGGHAHNIGLVPLLVLWLPHDKRASLPDWFEMIDSIDRRCAALSPDEVRTILNTTYAPTWKQLLHVGKYPYPYTR